MRVGFDVTQSAKRFPRGIARYINSIAPKIEANKGNIDPTFFVRGGKRFLLGFCPQESAAHVACWLPLGRPTAAFKLDLFHSFGNHLPNSTDVPCSMTVHDFRALDTSEDSQQKRRSRLERNIEGACAVICLTKHGKDRLQHYYPDIDVKRIAIVPHGIDHTIFRQRSHESVRSVVKRWGIERPYLLQLGSWFEHKNLRLSMLAFCRSRACIEGMELLFVGGGINSKKRKSLEEFAVTNGIGQRVRWIDNVPEHELPSLIQGAHCLVQPSAYEGFCLPVLEAMAMGTPGVIANATCLPEVSAGIWPAFELSGAEEYVECLDKICFDESLRSEIQAAGVNHAAAFTWDITARLTTQFVSQLIATELHKTTIGDTFPEFAHNTAET